MSRCRYQSCVAGAGLIVTGWIGIGLTGCGDAFTSSRTLSGSVAVQEARTLVVDSVVPVVIEAQTIGDEVTYELDAVITASSADTAERVADRIAVSVRRAAEGAEVVLTLSPPDQGTIAGQFRLSPPSALNLRGLQRAGTMEVFAVDGDIRVESIGSVRVVDPGADVSVEVRTGNAIVTSDLPGGSVTEVAVNTGDIQLNLPNRVSAAITAGASGSIVVSHPNLPAHLGGTLGYIVNINGGAATVRLSALRGNIVIANN